MESLRKLEVWGIWRWAVSKVLKCRPELDPQNPDEKADVVAHTCNPYTGEAEIVGLTGQPA